MKLLGLLTTVAGFVLVVLSFLWVVFFPPEDQWPVERAQEHRQAAAKFHQLQHTVGGGMRGPKGQTKPRATQAELEAAKKEWEQIDAELRIAQSSSKNTAWWIRLGGAATAALGVVVLIAAKKSDPARLHERNSH
jgi:hypothetical protein